MPTRDEPADEATEDIDYLDGADPDDIELGDDAVAVDLLGPPPTPGVPAGPELGFSFGKVVAVALAFTVLGFGIGTLMASDDTNDPSAIDVGFTRDMIDHHDQAVVMALIVLDETDLDPNVRSFATDVVVFQRWEVGIMDTFLSGWGETRGDLDRQAMVWMGEGVPLAAMPGMQGADEVAALDAASGGDADRLFLELMREHHVGGLHMAQFAAESADDPRVRSLAERISTNQTIEIEEYDALYERLGFGEPQVETSPPTGESHDGH